MNKPRKNSQRWHQQRLARKVYNLKTKYDLTPHDLDVLVETQHGLCPVCCRSFTLERPPNIDHDHQTGLVRGALCRECNTFLGRCNDSISYLEAALRYLVSAQKAPEKKICALENPIPNQL